MARPKGARDSDYEEKRTALLRRMMMRVLRRETARPSLRQLAEAAGVTAPTLRHYFGSSRAEVIAAILEEFLKMGQARLASAAMTSAPFAESIHEFALSLVRGMRHAGPVRLGDAFAVGLAEGLLDPAIGPSALRFMVDPAQQALQRRLDEHVARGEMIEADTRAASLMLLSPILIAALHQDQMGGSACNPLDLEAAVSGICDAFIRAYSRKREKA